MKEYRVEAPAPEVWFGRSIQVVWKLDIDDIIIVTLWSLDMWDTFDLIHIENVFRVRMGGLMLSVVLFTLLMRFAFLL